MSNRHAYILSYDITDPSRWRKVHRIALGHGDRLQLSVFRCELDAMERERLRLELEEVIVQTEDRVMLIDLGPLDGQEARRTLILGKASPTTSSGPTII
ncbi:MAG: CRISPR-associated endonuclease Cas2 [Planctomycetota bacterium]